MRSLHPTIWSRICLLAVIAILIAIYRFWPQPDPIPATAVRQPVLAILHFEDLGEKPDTNYFAEGFTCELIAKAGQLCSGHLGVIAHDSVVGYQKTRKSIHQMGRELDVDYIMEGGFGRDKDNVHVAVSLIRVSDQARLWSANYDRQIGELSDIQVAIIEKVGSSLGLKPSSGGIHALDQTSTRNPAAREAYLRAVGTCENETEREITKCIGLFQHAITADHGYGRAYGGLADAYIQRLEFGPTTPAGEYKLAENNARKAIQIADANPQAHHVLGEVLFRYDHDPKAAEAEFKQALALNGSDSTSYLRYAGFLLDQNRPDEALQQISYALAFDPFSTDVNIMAGRIEMRQGSYDRAIQQLEKTVSLNRDFPPGHYYLGEAYLARGEFSDAIREFQRAVSFKPNVPDFIAGLGRAYAAGGQKADAQAQLDALKKLAHDQPVAPELIDSLSQAIIGTHS